MVYKLGNSILTNWIYKERRCKKCGMVYRMYNNHCMACKNGGSHK